MDPDFESHGQNSTDGSDVESSPETPNANKRETHQKAAAESVDAFMDSLTDKALDRLDEDPTVDLKGRSWELEKFDKQPEEYWKIAFWQKQTQAITERINVISQQTEEVDPSSSEAGVSHYEMQILAGIRDFLRDKSTVHAKEVGLQLQHPEIYDQLTDIPDYKMN